MNHLVDDIRLALRGFQKTLGVTAVIVLALALGIGVNASCFIWVSALILHPFPYPGLERIVTVWDSPANQPDDRGAVSPANYLDLKKRSSSFEALAAFRPWNANLSGIGEPVHIEACLVTPEYFAALGVAPTLGRVLNEDDAQAGRRGALVVSHDFWTTHLASNPAALGTQVSLNGATFTIAGVMPEEFDFPLGTQIWAPLAFTAAERQDWGSRTVSMIGRLKRGVPVAQARAEFATLGRRMAVEHPETNEGRALQTVPLSELVQIYTARFLMTLLATAGFVLLLACANVANLLLVRVSGRQRELAIRTAMGASRARIAMQLLVESGFIALIAGALGLDLAAWSLSISKRTIPAEIYRWVGGMKHAHIDTTTVLMTLAVSLAAGFLCALPSLSLVLREAASKRLSDSLKESGRSSGAARSRSLLRTALAVSEVALALILLAGAGAMVSSFKRFLKVNPGFETAHLLMMEISLPQPKYAGSTAATEFYQRFLEDLPEIPGARAAAIRAVMPADAVYIEGRPAPRPGELVPQTQAVSPGFFETLRLPMIEGRVISWSDDRDHPGVAILSRSVARQYWPGESPIGRHIRFSKDDPRWLTVVGVCGDTTDWFGNQTEARAYVAFFQSPRVRPDARVYVSTFGDPSSVVRPVQGLVWKIDPVLALFDVKTMEQDITVQTSGVRSSSSSMTQYALIGLILAMTGIYGVISYSVARRTHEIGVRMALGADRATVLRMTLSDALRIGGVGLAIGIPLALAMLRAMSSVLFGVIQLDGWTFAALTLTLAFCAIAAGFVPAWRASRLDPVAALRDE
ncbi:MAG TPA: ABC transporter permease [Bryobacteraceae bacterium]|nr:ABC transporter permease [Bryobacteraceae bacterium]